MFKHFVIGYYSCDSRAVIVRMSCEVCSVRVLWLGYVISIENVSNRVYCVGISIVLVTNRLTVAPPLQPHQKSPIKYSPE